MPELELLPERTKRLELKTRKPYGKSIFVFVIVLAVYGGLFIYNQTLEGRISDLDADFTAFSQQRNRQAESRVDEVGDKLSQAQVLLDSHIFWSKGIKRIQGLTLPTVQFDSLRASYPESKFEFRAIAPNLSAIARQGANFLADDSVVDMGISQIKTLTDGRTEFVINLSFDRNKFLK